MCYFYPPVHSRSVRERTYVRVHGSPPVQCTLSSGKMSCPNLTHPMLLDVAGLFNNRVKRSSTILFFFFGCSYPTKRLNIINYIEMSTIYLEKQAQAATRSSFQEREKEEKKHLLQPLCGPLKTVVVFTYLHFVNGCVINPNVRYGNKSDF